MNVRFPHCRCPASWCGFSSRKVKPSGRATLSDIGQHFLLQSRCRPQIQRRTFRMVGSQDECDSQIEVLKRDQGATDADLFIRRLTVSPT